MRGGDVVSDGVDIAVEVKGEKPTPLHPEYLHLQVEVCHALIGHEVDGPS